MIWSFCFLLASLIVVADLALIIIIRTKVESLKRIKSLYFLLFGGFLFAATLCFPAYLADFAGSSHAGFKSFAYSVIDGIRVFATENIHENISEQINLVIATRKAEDIQIWGLKLYELFVIIIQFVAPFLTFGFVASFIKNFVPGVVYHIFTRRRTAHVFSELNEKTLALADSIITDAADKKGLAPLIVFTGCEKNDEDDEAVAKAREKGALIFRASIDSIKFKARKQSETDSQDGTKTKKQIRSKRKIVFYLTGENETEKIAYATDIIAKYDYDEVSMYVFSDSIECEMLLSAWDNENMQIYRVNDIQALIYHNLHIHGFRLFENAHKFNDNTISAVIVGLGRYGIETLKALVWYCQIPDFHIKITAFDTDPDAEAKFMAACPELMQKNHEDREGEACYDINIFGGVDAGRFDFYEKLTDVADATYIFVSLGSDEDNIATSARIRSEFQKIAPDRNPDIETVVYDSNITHEMSVTWEGEFHENDTKEGITNYKNQQYNIHMIGDLKSFYSVQTVIDSELIEKGMDVNKRWAETEAKKAEAEKSFWKYNYHYKSSIAKAIHEALRVKLIAHKFIPEINGVGKPWDELDDDEKLEIGRYEHIRWNAYMRSEGYRYAAKRDELAKTHDKLVSVKELKDDDLRKDA